MGEGGCAGILQMQGDGAPTLTCVVRGACCVFRVACCVIVDRCVSHKMNKFEELQHAASGRPSSAAPKKRALPKNDHFLIAHLR